MDTNFTHASAVGAMNIRKINNVWAALNQALRNSGVPIRFWG